MCASWPGGTSKVDHAIEVPRYFRYALAAAFSSLEAVLLTFLGLRRKSCRIFHSPWLGVPPKAEGARSDMSKRNVLACASAVAVARVSASGYAFAGTPLLGDEKPPRLAQMVAASGLAR